MARKFDLNCFISCALVVRATCGNICVSSSIVKFEISSRCGRISRIRTAPCEANGTRDCQCIRRAETEVASPNINHSDLVLPGDSKVNRESIMYPSSLPSRTLSHSLAHTTVFQQLCMCGICSALATFGSCGGQADRRQRNAAGHPHIVEILHITPVLR